MQSSLRQIKRGRLKSIYLESLKQTLWYRLSNRGQWICINSQTAKPISKEHMIKIQEKIQEKSNLN